MEDSIRRFVHAAIARCLVENLFANSQFNVELAKPSEHQREGAKTLYRIQPKSGGPSQFIDVRFRSQGGFAPNQDNWLPRIWRKWNEELPLTIIVVIPYEPYFKAVSVETYVKDDHQLPGDDEYCNVDTRWALNFSVLDVCVCLAQEYLERKQ